MSVLESYNQVLIKKNKKNIFDKFYMNVLKKKLI
jgi:hypothetical protein